MGACSVMHPEAEDQLLAPYINHYAKSIHTIRYDINERLRMKVFKKRYKRAVKKKKKG